MRRALLCAFGVALIACGGGGGGAAQPSTVSRPVRGPADVISEAEIKASGFQSALEVVQNLRPAMMRARGTSPQGGTVGIALFVDDTRMGDVGAMANIPADRVKEIRYINSRDATTRWGTGFGSGVIQVTTKR